MNFKAVWGFDPEASLQAQDAFRLIMAGNGGPVEETSEDLNDNNFRDALRIPLNRDAQINELQRMFRL